MTTIAESKSLSPLGSLTLLTVAALTIMVGCVIVPGLPAVAANLGIETSASWLVTLPSLGVVVFGPLAARLMEKMGLRRALMLGLFMYGLLGGAGVLLRGTWLIFADRLLLGGATAVVMAAGTGLISEFYQGHARLAMIAKQGMSIELGGVIFLFIGGLLAMQGWSYPFALYFIAWILLAFVKLTIPKAAEVPPNVHVASTSVGLSPALKTTFVAAALSMVVFFTGIIILPGKLMDNGFDEAKTGYFLSFISLVAIGGAALLPAISKRIGERGVLVIAMLAYAVAHICFVCSFIPALVVGAVMQGLGFGLCVPLVNHLTIEHSTDRSRGRNLAYLSMAIFSGQFLSSFMEFVPGNSSTIFMTAAMMSLFSAAAFAVHMKAGQKPTSKYSN
ncbi:MFS transporter [Azotobacter beijerinckii]|uniref:MFS transporter n=1 Tax=Azotobacter beijerinckii TaxID=170623 RepID=UPI0029551AD9|nr:MFS transporter [Azotobacter beijerinckii]MDV7211124.1 MFS transporter [Azotobacter beijerinckii]